MHMFLHIPIFKWKKENTNTLNVYIFINFIVFPTEKKLQLDKKDHLNFYPSCHVKASLFLHLPFRLGPGDYEP